MNRISHSALDTLPGGQEAWRERMRCDNTPRKSGCRWPSAYQLREVHGQRLKWIFCDAFAGCVGALVDRKQPSIMPS